MATYWRLLRQSSCGPLSPSYCCRHGALPSQLIASVATANSSTTRSGVQKRDRPTSACRPIGPPTIRLTDATSGSDHVGMSRGKGSVTTHLPAPAPPTYSTERAQALADRHILQPSGDGPVPGQHVVHARQRQRAALDEHPPGH